MYVVTDAMVIAARKRWPNRDGYDIVKCLNCRFEGPVEPGGNICPECNEDHLIWADEVSQEFAL